MSTYKHIIVGAGAAGLHLSLAMIRGKLLNKDNRLLIIEADSKTKNDKTWCFWEKTQGHWDNIVTKIWEQGEVVAQNEKIHFNLGDYRYKMLKSIDFYSHAKSIIEKHPHVDWLEDQVKDISELPSGQVEVTTTNDNFTTCYAFDSRIPHSFLNQNKYLNINQHFKGWFIETESAQFNDRGFTMMDFRIKDGHSTSFTYVLPLTQHQALIEFTYFTEHRVNSDVYDGFLKKYLSLQNISDYKITEIEQGNIHMSNFPFDKKLSKHIIKIGTAGGWVKASTGYAFKNCERKSNQIVEALLNNQEPSLVSASKYKHYDKLFLDVLSNHNGFGEKLFYKMYKHNKIDLIFRFLDEASSFSDDISIILKLTSLPFLKAFGKHIVSGFKVS